jgi:hypothetical protein
MEPSVDHRVKHLVDAARLLHLTCHCLRSGRQRELADEASALLAKVRRVADEQLREMTRSVYSSRSA